MMFGLGRGIELGKGSSIGKGVLTVRIRGLTGANGGTSNRAASILSGSKSEMNGTWPADPARFEESMSGAPPFASTKGIVEPFGGLSALKRRSRDSMKPGAQHHEFM